jgi:hypothetical protein
LQVLVYTSKKEQSGRIVDLALTQKCVTLTRKNKVKTLFLPYY